MLKEPAFLPKQKHTLSKDIIQLVRMIIVSYNIVKVNREKSRIMTDFEKYFLILLFLLFNTGLQKNSADREKVSIIRIANYTLPCATWQR